MDQTLPPAAPTIAVATSGGGRIDHHFGQAEAFEIFRPGPHGPERIETRRISDHAQGDEDRRDTICRMLSDCAVLLVAKIGPNPQEKLARAGIEASDLHADRPVDAAVAEIFAARAAAQADTPLEAGSFRIVHTMLRVADIDRSLAFYTELLGMRLIERRDHKRNLFTQAYVGFESGAALELVFNWTQDAPYVLGDSFGHIAIEVEGITALCDRLTAAGIPMPRPPRSQRHGESIVAFVEDPDGHRIELIQRPTQGDS